MLTWEFPPRSIGGISTLVYHLSTALVEKGTPVRVITCDFPKTPDEEIIDGVSVSRVISGRVPESNFLLWIYHLNSQMISKATELFETERFDLIHDHDCVLVRAGREAQS